MKAVILAGGKGSRISEKSKYMPKPLIEVGGKPIIWHIMKLYSYYGVDDFIICCGYKGHLLKEYFVNYNSTQIDNIYCLDTKEDEAKVIMEKLPNKDIEREAFRVTLVNTGLETLTAGRLLSVRQFLEGEEEFFLTYGDGVSDVNISELLEFHKQHGKCVTITTYEKEERFGRMTFKENDAIIEKFQEKGKAEGTYINAGFMVMNHKVFDYLGTGDEMLEDGPFEKISANGEMAAYRHRGFWSPMDTLKEQMYLENLVNSRQAPWMLWE